MSIPRQVTIDIAKNQLLHAVCKLEEARAVYAACHARYLEALALPPDAQEPLPEIEPMPVIEPTPEPEPVVEPMPEPAPVVEPTPEPEPVIQQRRYFDFAGELAGYLASNHWATADVSFGLRTIHMEAQEHIIAPTSAGSLEHLFEHHFGAGNVQGLRWEGPALVSLDAATTVEALGMLTHGGSQYREVEGYLA